MKIIRNIINFPPLPGCVLTIGNFDGIHLGHKKVLENVCQQANQFRLPSVAMIFEPQPLEYFDAALAPARLTSFREKYHQIEKIGLDYLLCIPFNKQVVRLTAEKFIQQWLLQRLVVKHLIIGEDFAFGSNREGCADLLAQYADSGTFTLEIVPLSSQHTRRISSTAIRRALANEQFELARQLLGRCYSICGRVVRGNSMGRQLGFPTANIHLGRSRTPLSGVYFVKVDDQTAHKKYSGVANIGHRPTFNRKKLVLEVNIFDFDEIIYGHYLQVTFFRKIREEKKFPTIEALKVQIKSDVCIAKQFGAEL